MFDFLGTRRKRRLDELLNVETILQSSLKPVSPRPEFIENLHKGLMDYSFPQPDTSDYNVRKTILIAFVGFAGLIFVLSIWVRLLVLIISTLGIIQSSRQTKEFKP